MREAILHAMRVTIARHGGRPTLDEIAAAAGMTTRTVQDYFTTGAAVESAIIAYLDPDTPADSTSQPDVGTPPDRPRQRRW